MIDLSDIAVGHILAVFLQTAAHFCAEFQIIRRNAAIFAGIDAVSVLIEQIEKSICLLGDLIHIFRDIVPEQILSRILSAVFRELFRHNIAGTEAAAIVILLIF